MPHLFSPLHLARVRLPNRIALASSASGLADGSGFVSPPLAEFYLRRARGGVGLLLTEPALVTPPEPGESCTHLGLYHDAQVPALAQLARAVHEEGSHLILPLESPASEASAAAARLDELRERYLCAAWRALGAGCDGVMLSVADGGLLHALASPLHNRRDDGYGGGLDGRLRLTLELIEGMRAWFGKRLLVAFRLNADELTAGGMGLQDARVIARRAANAGAGLLDVTIVEPPGASIARFPGWRVPLAAAIKRVLPDVPVMTSGSLGEPRLADGVIREGSADLVQLGHSLRSDPDWPQRARAELGGSNGAAPSRPALSELLFGEE